MSDKMKNLAVRTLSGIAMLCLLLAGVLWSPWSFGALVLLVLVSGQIEFYRLAALRGASPQRVVGIAMSLGFWLWCFSGFADIAGFDTPLFATVGTCGLLCALLLLPLCFVCELFRGGDDPMVNIGVTLGGVFYLTLPLAMLPYLSLHAADGAWNPWAILFFIFIIWANDVFAYLVGITCGRHRLCERISPKKSWEGFFGGVAGAVVMGAAAARIFDWSVGVWCGLAVVAAVTGVLGDLVESMFKRSVGVKDSGNAIPGHGGVLDRFDALLLATPFVCVYLKVVMLLNL